MFSGVSARSRRRLLKRSGVRRDERPGAAGVTPRGRGLAVGGALLVFAALALAVGDAHAFGLDDVMARASKLAGASYQKPSSALPKSLKALDYDQHRNIRFRPERALWRDARLPFEIMFFHPGWFYEDTVTIHEITAEGLRDIRFDPDAFEFFDAGEKVVVFARAVGTGKGSGVEAIQDEAHIWTLSDGRMRLGVSYRDRSEALKAAGLSE